eukprot:gene17166-23649_t
MSSILKQSTKDSEEDGDEINSLILNDNNKKNDDTLKTQLSHQTEKLVAALFYGICSILVIFSNKSILTQHQFPYFDFLAFVQFVVTTSILTILILMKRIDVPYLTYPIIREILPISLMFLGNVICGLGSTRSLNLPMFTALRRFSIMMTMIGESCFLNTKPSFLIILSVSMMVGGAFLAACYDLTFDAYGYFLVFLNNLFTALNGVWIKKASISGICSKMGVLYYNSLFSAIFMFLFFFMEYIYYAVENNKNNNINNYGALQHKEAILFPHLKEHLPMLRKALSMSTNSNNMVSNNIEFKSSEQSISIATTTSIPFHDNMQHSTLYSIYQFQKWNNSQFVFMFILAACMGSILNYSIFLCTTLNSALTTAVVGALKNVAIAYIGMIAFADYSFTWVNFIGINISILGSLYYTYITIFKGVQGFGGG